MRSWQPLSLAATVLITAVAGMVASSCGKQIPEPANVAHGTPHVSWVIMAGDAENADANFICQTSTPASDCVVPATGPGGKVFSDVHLYYHSAGGKTKYTGSIDVGFFSGAAADNDVPVNITVAKNEGISNQSVQGLVTDKPGTYAVTFDLNAATPGGDQRPVHDEIRVVVK